MSRPTYMTIDLDALVHNLRRIRHLVPKHSVIAMVKANAYGHGILRVAKALQTVDAFGVASLEEGIMLRDEGITQSIVLMEGLFYPDELALAAKHHFTLVIHHEAHIRMLEENKIKHVFNVWLKINTGMHRLGIDPNDIAAFHARLTKLPSVNPPIGLMTHFAEADNRNSDKTNQQINLFNSITKNFAGPRSLANSAAILAYPEAHGCWIRPGLMLYGASPFADNTGLDYQLKPVMTLASRLIAITPVKRGGKVGYGGTWTAGEDTRVGVVGVGYGDGYPQFAGNGTPVLVNGKVCPLAGRVSMDMLTVDLTKEPNAQIGDPVTLWGNGLPVEHIAEHNHTSPYEVLTRMTPRPKIDVKFVTKESALVS